MNKYAIELTQLELDALFSICCNCQDDLPDIINGGAARISAGRRAIRKVTIAIKRSEHSLFDEKETGK